MLDSHPLNVEETNVVKVSYEKMQGGFCVCILIVIHTCVDGDFPKGISESGINTKEYVFRGASRRSYKDTPNSIKGEMLAFRRAILFSRPVELS